MEVRDKVVAITGAARGLGQEFATSLAAAGARVVVGDVNDCAETLDRVKQAGPEGARRQARCDRCRLGARDDRCGGAGLRAGRCADQQCRALWRVARRPLRRDRRGRVGRRDGGQRQGHLELLQGGGSGDAQGRRRQHRQHRLARRHLRHALRAALHDVEGGRDRSDPRSGARSSGATASASTRWRRARSSPRERANSSATSSTARWTR